MKQLTEAVTTAHETSDTFSNETLREQATFQFAKEAEMKEMLSNLADGQIELYRNVSNLFHLRVMFVYAGQAMEEWDRIIPIIQRIRVDV
jgi:sorting nexin-4